MEPQNIVSSSYHHTLLPNNFVSSVPVQFLETNLCPIVTTTSKNIVENISSPSFMSTLQQLSNGTFLPLNSQINSNIDNQFSTNNIVNLNSQSVLFDQAKMAAMLPMYFQSATSSSFGINANCQNDSQQLLLSNEQTLKNQTSSAIPAQTIFWNDKNFYSNDFINNNNGNHTQSITSNLDNTNSDVRSSSLFINAKTVQPQQHSVNRVVQQSKFQNIHSSHQSPLSSVGSPINNINRIIPLHHHSSYPPSKSSLSSSNEGMIESPLSTYSNLTQHHHSHEPVVDASSNSPYNYQNTFLLQKKNYEQQSSITKASPNQINISPSSSKLKYQSVNLNTFNQLIFDNNNSNFIDFSPQNSTFQPLSCNNNINNFTNDSTKQNQELINNKTNISYPSNLSTTNGVNLNEGVEDLSVLDLNGGVEDLSVLDLNDFEDFLNDKNDVSNGLTIDPTTIFNSVQVENSSNSNQINLDSSSDTKSIVNNQKNSYNSASNNLLITSAKMRERIHEKRAEELANVDKELDRLVSLVARQNDAKNLKDYSKLNNSFLNDVFNSVKQQPLNSKLNKSELNLSQTILQPVQFTPPDSPTNFESDLLPINITTKKETFDSLNLLKPLNSISNQTTLQKLSNNSLKDSTNTTKSLNFIDKTNQLNINTNSFKNQQQQQKQQLNTNSNNSGKSTKTSFSQIKYNRVPIYKQNIQKTIFPQRESNVLSAKESENTTLSSVTPNNKYKFSISEKLSKDDAYSFTDDDDEVEETAIPKSVASSVSTTASTILPNDSGNVTKTKLKKSYEQIKQMQNSSGNETSLFTDGSIRNSIALKKKCTNSLLNNNKKKISLSTPLSSNQKSDSLPFSTDKSLSQSSTLADIICQRRINNCNIEKFEFESNDNNSFLSENYDHLKNSYKFNNANDFLMNDEYSIATCKIKIENRENNINYENGVEEKFLPKLIIKFNKLENLYNSEIFLLNEYKQKLKKKKKKKKRNKCREFCEDFQQQNYKINDSHHKRRHKKHKKEDQCFYSIDDKNNDENFVFTKRKLDQESISSSNEMTPISDDLNKLNCLPVLLNENRDNSLNTNLSDNLKKEYEENNSEKSISVKEFLKKLKQISSVNDFTSNFFIKNRLKSLLKTNDEAFSKGTFLIAKDDAFKVECSLWKIDNQNLLQKYFPIFVENNEIKEIHYKNSSTYSGWCDKIADDYMVVDVIFIKQSRSECIVKPSVPICDLFPTISKNITENVCSILIEEKNNNSDSNDDSSTSINTSKNELKEHLKVFIKALLKHVISLNFLQTIKISNDWNYLCAFNEIDKQILETSTKILTRVKWTKQFKNAINFYSHYFIFKIGDTSNLCQACETNNFSISIYFYSNEICNNFDLIQTINENNFDSKAVLSFMICNVCERLAILYHKNQHMKYHLFKKCEDKLEIASHEFSNFTSDSLIEHCINQKSWLQSIVTEYIELWKKCSNVYI